MRAECIRTAVVTAVVSACAAAWAEARSSTLSFDDIHYWVGEGTNRCALVVDWSVGYDKTLAWGYRWNGICTNFAEVVLRIAHEDSRLKVSRNSYGFFTFFGYDVNDCHPTWHIPNDDSGNASASDAEAPRLSQNVSDRDYVYWVFYGPFNGSSFPSDAKTSSLYAANNVMPQNNDWFVFSYGCPKYGENRVEAIVLRNPEPAESPYGWRVVASATAESDTWYANPENALGHPTMFMAVDEEWGGVVNPANSAWKGGELFSLASYGTEYANPGEMDGPGYVAIEFDHKVVDDPANPFGLDFIVFGNAGATWDDSSSYTPTTDPASVSLNGTGWPEEAKVEVSQDGKKWHAVDTERTADGFAPTLGHLYEPDRADADLYEGNMWWGRAASATKPVDPSIDFADLKGLTLADVCRRYNGSAGGTGYDISKLPLSTDEKGRKWIRYVRISGVYVEDNGEGDSGYTAPEVDAVADVAPVSAYERWVETHYTDWATAWDTTVTGPNARARNGRPNAVNYVLGIGPSAVADGMDFRIESFTPGTNTHVLTLRSNVPLTASSGVVVKKTKRLTAKWTTELPIVESSVEGEDGTWTTTFSVSAGDGAKFFSLGLDVE